MRQHALEARVLALDRHHGVVDELADLGLLGIRLQVRPARLARHPEDVLGEVLVAVLGVDAGLAGAAGRKAPGGLVLGLRQQGRVLLLERVGDVLEEDEAEHHVLVLGRVHVAAHLVGRGPELLLEAEGLAVAVLLDGLSPFTTSTHQSSTARNAIIEPSSARLANGMLGRLSMASVESETPGISFSRATNSSRLPTSSNGGRRRMNWNHISTRPYV